MTSVDTQQILLVGLPKAGKTTFVAAFWHVVSTNEVNGSLIATSLGGEDEYLNQIRDSWISYQPLERTSQQDESIPLIHLADATESRKCTLSVPDLSGETYRRQWVDREWTEKVDLLAQQSSALIVFVHPSQNIEPTEITATLRLLLPTEDEPDEEEHLSSKASATQEAQSIASEIGEEPLWDPELANDVVQLVDVLQAFRERVNRPLRIALVISAWDLVRDYFKTPDDYLEKKLSLLSQYLESNSNVISSKVFGLSATGTALDDKESCVRLQKTTTFASERIEVVEGLSKDHDITKPLQWALEW